jgi:hypothetical protein
MVFCGIGYLSTLVLLWWWKWRLIVVKISYANDKARKLPLATHWEWKVLDASSEIECLQFR